MDLQIQQNPYKTPFGFFVEIDKLDPKMHMEMQGTKNNQNSLKKEHSWNPNSQF